MARHFLQQFKRNTKLLLSMTRGPWMTAERLTSGAQSLGVREGGVLLVHSSLKALGFVPGGALTVISALQKAVGLNGTLVLPTHTWEWTSKGLRQIDVRTTPSCVGTITEVFRNLPDVIRSLHPTHSVAARGPQAAWLVEGHENSSTPCGAGTPYARLIESAGQILFLGCRLDRNTAFHTLEAMAEVPYLLRDESETYELIDRHGQVLQREVRRHRDRIPRRFNEMEPRLAEAGALARRKIGAAACLLVDSRVMCNTLLTELQCDPDFLVARATERPKAQ